MTKWIIQREANESGSRANQSWSGMIPPNGYVWTTEEDIMNIYVPFKGFVDLIVDGDTVVTMTGNQELLDKWNAEHPEHVYTNAERRQQCYETGKAIDDDRDFHVTWDGKQYTTDELSTLCERYEIRGETATAEEIKAIIVAGVAAIRAAFPDENE